MKETRYTITVHDHKTDEIKEYPANALILGYTDSIVTGGCILCDCKPTDAAIMLGHVIADIDELRQSEPMMDRMIETVYEIKKRGRGETNGEIVELGAEQ